MGTPSFKHKNKEK